MTGRKLPKGWVEVGLEHVVLYKKGKKPSILKEEYFEGSVPYLDIRALEKDEIRQYADSKSSNLFDANSVAIVWDGARSGWVSKGKQGALGSTIASLTPVLINVDYLFYFLQTNFEFLNSNTRGTGIPHVDPGTLWSMKFPIAPLVEQGRIVTKLDVAFTHLNTLKTSLARIPEMIKNFRQAILTKAATGKLTANWREINKEQSGQLLLEDAIEIRKQNWIDRRLAELKASGKKIINDDWKEKYPKPFSLNKRVFQTLPESWAETVWDQISDWVTYGFTRPMPHTETGIPIITGKNVIEGKIYFDTANFTSESAYKELNEKDKPQKGDLLITKDGTIGRAAVVETDEPFCINQSVAVVWLKNSPFERKYLLYVVMCKEVQDEIKLHTKGVAVQHLSVTDFRKMHLPVPPLEEQKEIVKTVEELFETADLIESKYLSLKEKIDALPQALLTKAFKGELEPQDEKDEPASELLKQINAIKEQTSELRNTKNIYKEKNRKPTIMPTLIEILKSANKPVDAKTLWELSDFSKDIDAFYAALKTEVEENKTIKEDTDKTLSLTNEN